MSQLLTESLEGSALLKPWYKLATLPSATWQAWLKGSSLPCCQSTAENDDNVVVLKPTFFQKIVSKLFFAGVVLLLITLAFMGTGMIGAGVIALLGLGFLVRVFCKRTVAPFQVTSVDVLVLLFICSAALSTAFSSYWHTSIVGLGKFLIFASGYIVFRWASLVSGPRKTVIRLLWVLALLGCFESLVGFYQYVMHVQPLATWSDPSINSELKMDRIFGTLQPSNPNLLAGFLTPCLAASFGLTLLYLKKNTWFISLAMALTSLA